MRGDKSWYERLGGLRHFLENLQAVCQMGIVCLADFIFPIAIFHLADRDGFIRAVYQKVNLCSTFQVFVCLLVCHNFGIPDYQLSLAIGKAGQNARLAAKLTNWKIDIKSETQANEEGFGETDSADVDDDILGDIESDMGEEAKE